MLRNLFFIFTILIFISLSGSSKAEGQIISSDNNCENNLSLLHRTLTPTGTGNPIIIIAYRGKRENSVKYSQERLNTIKTALGSKTIVFAIGEKLVTKPKIEIYVDGKLDVVLEIKNHEKLRVQHCGLLY
jgi:hypothetical protein